MEPIFGPLRLWPKSHVTHYRIATLVEPIGTGIGPTKTCVAYTECPEDAPINWNVGPTDGDILSIDLVPCNQGPWTQAV